MAIKKFINEYGDNAEKPFTKVKHLLGVVESGVTDLGQRHRDHLIQKINRVNLSRRSLLPWRRLIRAIRVKNNSSPSK